MGALIVVHQDRALCRKSLTREFLWKKATRTESYQTSRWRAFEVRTRSLANILIAGLYGAEGGWTKLPKACQSITAYIHNVEIPENVLFVLSKHVNPLRSTTRFNYALSHVQRTSVSRVQSPPSFASSHWAGKAHTSCRELYLENPAHYLKTPLSSFFLLPVPPRQPLKGVLQQLFSPCPACAARVLCRLPGAVAPGDDLHAAVLLGGVHEREPGRHLVDLPGNFVQIRSVLKRRGF